MFRKRKWIVGIVAVVLVMALAVVSANAQAASKAKAGPKKKSDIVGNDGVANFGHVGLYDGSSKILEVRNDKKGINGTCVHNDRTLTDFKKGGYWGAKYYYNGKELSSGILMQIFDWLKKQGDSYNATYSLDPQSFRFRVAGQSYVINKDGKLELKNVTGIAILRCDLSVAAAYKLAAEVDLLDPSGYLTPKTLFNNKMLKSR